MDRAQQLYEAAQLEEERLTEYKKAAGNLLATKGDYFILAELYGLTEDQVKALGGDISTLTPVTDTSTGTTETITEGGTAAADTTYETPEALKDDED